MDVKKRTVFYDKLTFIYLEMPKFNKSVDELKTHFDKWMYLLKHLPKLQGLPSKIQEQIFKKMCRVAEIAKMTKEETAEYENSLKLYRDWYSTINTAREEGREEGKVEIALNLLKQGVSVEIICNATGLSLEQIKGLTK
jgi:predicted transposase/invertase (TIGR01784 family)